MELYIESFKTNCYKVKRQHTICVNEYDFRSKHWYAKPITTNCLYTLNQMGIPYNAFKDLIINTQSCRFDRLAYGNKDKAEATLLALKLMEVVG